MLVGLFNLSDHHDARAIALSSLPLHLRDDEEVREPPLLPSGDVSAGRGVRLLERTGLHLHLQPQLVSLSPQCTRGWASAICAIQIPAHSAALLAVSCARASRSR